MQAHSINKVLLQETHMVKNLLTITQSDWSLLIFGSANSANLLSALKEKPWSLEKGLQMDVDICRNEMIDCFFRSKPSDFSKAALSR